MAELANASSTCPHCEADVGIDATWVGRQVACTGCGIVFTVQQARFGSSLPLASLTLETQIRHSSLEDTAQEGREEFQSASVAAPMPEKLGRYEIRRILGEGAFGTVYRGYDPVLNREVAIKVPRTHGRHYDEDRFRNEARAAAGLRHPNIVAVFDHDKANGQAYIVYEFVAGKTLQDKLAEERVPTESAVNIAIQISDALHYAHTQDIVHRDIKPSNVMIDHSGLPQVMDFGLATASVKEIESRAGEIAGTPAYMSPEQAVGGSDIKSATDQYSLSAVLHEMLVGERPPSALTMAAEAEDESAAHGRISEKFLAAGIPSDLAVICAKALARDPDNRYESLADFRNDLANWRTGYPITARPAGPLVRFQKWTQRNPAIARLTLAIGCLMCLAAAGSSIFAIVLHGKQQELQFALSQSKLANIKATRAKTEAEQQRDIAKKNEALAESALTEASKARDVAQKEIAERIEADRLREEADKLAAAERSARGAAEAQNAIAQRDLLTAAQNAKTLTYRKLIRQANIEFRSGQTSLCRSTLDTTDKDQRAWEWRFLREQALVTEGSYNRSLQNDAAFIEPLSLPVSFSRLASQGIPNDDSQIVVLRRIPKTNRGFVIIQKNLGKTKDYRQNVRLSLHWLDAEAGTAPELVGFNTLTKRTRSGNRNPFPKTEALEGHIAADVSRDGRFLACVMRRQVYNTGPTDSRVSESESRVRAWSVAGLELLLDEFKDVGNGAFVAVHPTLPVLALVRDYKLPCEIWNLEKGELIRKFELQDHPANSDCFRITSDSILRVVNAINADHYDISDGELLHRTTFNPRIDDSFRISLDQSGRAAIGDSTRTESAAELDDLLPTRLMLWDLGEGGRRFAVVDGPSTTAEQVAGRLRWWRKPLATSEFITNDDGSRFAVRDSLGNIHQWSRTEDENLAMANLGDGLTAASFNAAGSKLIFARERKLSATDLEPIRPQGIRATHIGSVNNIKFGPSGARCVSLGDGGRVVVSDVTTRTVERTFSLTDVADVGLSSVGDTMVSVHKDGQLRGWSLTTGEERFSTTAHVGAATFVCISPNDDVAISAGTDNQLCLWDLATGKKLAQTPSDSTDRVNRIIAHPNLRVFAMLSQDLTLSLWAYDRTSFEKRGTFYSQSPAKCLTFHPTEPRLVVAAASQMSVLDTRDLNKLIDLPPTRSNVLDLQFLNESDLASCDDKGNIQIYRSFQVTIAETTEGKQ